MMNLIRTLMALFLLTFTSGSYMAEAQDPCAGGFSPSFRLGGQVTNPKTYDLQELQNLPLTQVHDVFLAGTGVDEGTFTGVLLWDLIEAAGVIVDPNQRNDLLRKYVLITGSDCYESLYSMGELSPRIGGSHPVIVAFQRDGELLGPDEGMARIINPGDKFGARRVFNITRIRVLGRPAPQ
jgi:DMSO/TMAO reductase YedYZ molybdopterin-dependent catalytic subunit